MKDGSSLVVTPSSIPNSTTRGPDVDLSSEGSEDVFEGPNDEPVLKKRISDSDDEEDAPLRPNSWVCAFLPSFCFWLCPFLPLFCYLFLRRMYLHLPFATIPFNLYVYFHILQRLLRGQG